MRKALCGEALQLHCLQMAIRPLQQRVHRFLNPCCKQTHQTKLPAIKPLLHLIHLECLYPPACTGTFPSGFDLSLMRLVMRAQIKSECCTPEPLHLAASIGWQGLHIDIANQESQWPAHWLVGLGAPWNTVQPEGAMQLRTENLKWLSNAGAPKIQGLAELTLSQIATPLSTLRPLGTYRLRMQGGDTMAVTLATLEGGLQLSGNGQWANGRLRFKGEARAQPAFEAALSNLLNILGQRQGAISIMELG